MTLGLVEQLAWVAAASSVVMLLLWFVQRRTRDAGVVDVGWAACLGGAALLCAVSGDGDPLRRILIGVMGGVWGLRLALHLLFDRVLRGPEDGRYQMLRERLGSRTQPVLLAFFLAQALSVALLANPFALASGDDRPAPATLDLLGLALWTAGVIGESIADAQLARFKANPAHAGQVCAIGMWRYSRHPNYFFEWLLWVGYALVATAAPLGWLAWSAPAVMLYLVVAVTGIPPTEARSLRSRGDAYRAYQRSTSAFVPWFPAKASRPNRSSPS